MNGKRKKRVLVAKAGLDGHDRGAKAIARLLKDSGMEVIYTGLHQTPEQIVNAAIQEDVDVIGLSILSGTHMGISRKILENLKEKGAEKIAYIVGGIIIDRDIEKLKNMGVAEVFPMGSDIDDVVAFFEEHGHE
jgi:methylmalonyl-CoA mutase C-terminal domain/subunit